MHIGPPSKRHVAALAAAPRLECRDEADAETALGPPLRAPGMNSIVASCPLERFLHLPPG